MAGHSPRSVEEILALMGGAEAAAARCGVGTEAIRKWRQARAIPARHWPAVLAATGLSLAEPAGCPRSGAADDHHRRHPARGRHRRARAGRWHAVLGPRLRRCPHRRGRGVLHHRHDRLPGDADRSLLRRADHHLHFSPYRQRRLQPRGSGGRRPRLPGLDRQAGGDGTGKLARHPAPGGVACFPRRAGDRRGGYPCADAPHPRRRRPPPACCASPPTAASTSPPCGNRRPPGRGSRGWTSPKR